MSLRPYLASEDSALLRNSLGGYSGTACLEIGTGNAGTLEELSRRFELAAGTDLVRPDPRIRGEQSVNFVLADRASCFRDSSFDLVAFNPPYIPSGTIGDVAVDGGREGTEVPLSFLREALRVVKKNGKVVLLLSGENRVDELEILCATKGFRMRKVAEERLFYERLFIYEASGD